MARLKAARTLKDHGSVLSALREGTGDRRRFLAALRERDRGSFDPLSGVECGLKDHGSVLSALREGTGDR
ncbi:MAG: hypothetical protein ACLFSB_13450, partial [Chitinispirillaceae bacterium]